MLSISSLRHRRSSPKIESDDDLSDLEWDGYEQKAIHIRADLLEMPPPNDCDPFRRREYYCIASLSDNYDSGDEETIIDEPSDCDTTEIFANETVNDKTLTHQEPSLPDKKPPTPATIQPNVEPSQEPPPPAAIQPNVKPSIGARVVSVIRSLAKNVVSIQQHFHNRMQQMASTLFGRQQQQPTLPAPTTMTAHTVPELPIYYDRLRWLIDNNFANVPATQMADVERMCRRQAIHVGHVLLHRTGPSDLANVRRTTGAMLLDGCPAEEAERRRCRCGQSGRGCGCGPGAYFLQGFSDFVCDHVQALGYWGLLVAFVRAVDMMWALLCARAPLRWVLEWRQWRSIFGGMME